MRYQDIFEAPLADFGTFGDPDTEGSFRPDDLRAMKSPAWQKKIENVFKKSPYKFNVYLYNGENGMAPVIPKKPSWDKSQSSDAVLDVRSLKHLKAYAGVQPLKVVEQMIGKLPPDAEDSISVVLVENEGTKRMPLTPWVLVHRIVHAVIYAGYAATVGQFLQDFVRSSERKLSVEQSKYADQFTDVDDNYERISIVASILGKMKSAKTKNLASDGEFLVEVITQYIINGHLSFERPMLDDKGLAPEHPAMTVIPQKYRDAALISNNSDDFLKELGFKYLRKPRDYYTAYDQDGHAVVQGMIDPVRIQRAKDQGYTVKEFHITPKQQNIYDKKMQERQSLKDAWDKWSVDGVISWDYRYYATISSDLHNSINFWEKKMNGEIDQMLKRCVGQALVL